MGREGGKMRCVAAVLSLMLLVVVFWASAADGQQQLRLPAPERRPNFRLPKLFNFAQFKANFHKHYSSLVEEICRRKIYLGHAVQAFVSLVKYSHFRCSSYLSVNERSDLTPRELRASYRPAARLQPPQMGAETELHHLNEDEDEEEDGDTNLMEEVEEIPVAELEEIGQQLRVVELHGQEPGYRELASELHKQVEAEVFDQQQRQQQQVEVEVARVPSNNPSYSQHGPILLSKQEAAPSSALSNGLMSIIQGIPGVNFVHNLMSETANRLANGLANWWLADEINEMRDKEQMELDRLPDEVWVDFRKSGCLGPIKAQGRCGSCYAFAGAAYYEYLYCRSTGQQVSFSEQYIVSCGHRTEMAACEGGRMDLVSEFVDAYGLELAQDFPYLVANGTCPYDERTPSLYMGYIKPHRGGFRWLKMDKFDDYLDKKSFAGLPAHRPIMFGMGVSPDFDHYGGGVAEPAECLEEYGHAMLLVGHGREDGREYYLFRNSYGPNWGERGYYKLDKRAMRRCASAYYGVISTARFLPNHSDNPNQLSRQVLGKKRGSDQLESTLDELDEARRRQQRARSSLLV